MLTEMIRSTSSCQCGCNSNCPNIMYINEIRLENFRNFPALFFNPSPNLNILYGENGAGKTSILESIYLLSFGRSFRTSKLDSIVNYDATEATTFCKFLRDDKQSKLGFTRIKNKQNVFSIDGIKSKRLSDMARVLPVQVFTPQSSDLVIGAPIGRRRYIDWLLFHVEHDYYQLNKKYLQSLQQRNALLKMFDYEQLDRFMEQDVWLKPLSEYGAQISLMREHYIELLNEEINELFGQFYPELSVAMRYNNGWDRSKTLLETLKYKAQRDLFKGNTGFGPHKADIEFLVSGHQASEYLSRGQLRLLVSVLLLAEVKLLNKLKQKSTIFLIDDVSAELDEMKREKFIDTILEYNAQIFITAIDKQQINFIHKYKNKKMFHVKHNHVKEE